LGRLWVASMHTGAGHRGGLVLVVDHQVPSPDKDSGSVRMRRLLDVLVAQGARVVFFASNGALPRGYTDDLQQAGVTVLADEAGQHEFLREAGEELRLVLLSRPNVAWRYLEQVRDCAPQALLAYDTVDLHFVRLGRQAELAAELGDTARAAALRKRADASRELELGLVRSADVALTVSDSERAVLTAHVPDAEFAVLSNVHIERGPAATPSGRTRLLFVGSFDHPPNVDAARWLAEEIMPLVRKRCPEAVLDLVGSNPPAEVLALDGDGVVSHGWVPDLAPLYAAARLSVAPLRFGAGVKGKVGESLGHGVPVVGTPVAFEGTALTEGREVLIGTTAEQIADAVVTALGDDELWQRLSDAGRATIAEQFGPELARATLNDLLAEAARRTNPGII
ncbi:MAG: glycosyltransferase family 4 protein, partial [Sciscionella sp.]